MNKHDTAANRSLIEKAAADRIVSQPGSTSDEVRVAVLIAIGNKFPGERNLAKRDALVDLFDTMLAEELDRLDREDADRAALV